MSRNLGLTPNLVPIDNWCYWLQFRKPCSIIIHFNPNISNPNSTNPYWNESFWESWNPAKVHYLKIKLACPLGFRCIVFCNNQEWNSNDFTYWTSAWVGYRSIVSRTNGDVPVHLCIGPPPMADAQYAVHFPPVRLDCLPHFHSVMMTSDHPGFHWFPKLVDHQCSQLDGAPV